MPNHVVLTREKEEASIKDVESINNDFTLLHNALTGPTAGAKIIGWFKEFSGKITDKFGIQAGDYLESLLKNTDKGAKAYQTVKDQDKARAKEEHASYVRARERWNDPDVRRERGMRLVAANRGLG